MAEVQVRVNGRVYAVGCADGQERHVLELAQIFDQQVAQVAREVGQLGESRLFLLGALLLADELAEARSRLEAADAEMADAGQARLRLESRAVEVIEQAARTIEELAARAG
jgi:cell division protein ZapA